MADENSFFVDEELIERLLGGGKESKKEPQIDPAPKPESPKRPVEAQLSSVLVLDREGKTEQALAVANKLVADMPINKKDPDPLWVKGHLHFEQKQFAEAAEAYRKAAEVDPNHRTAHYNYGLSLERLGDFQEASEAFARAAAINPKVWQARLGQAVCALEMKNPEQAIEHFQAVLAAEPQHRQARLGLAIAQQTMGKLDDAAILFTALQAEEPDQPEVLEGLVVIHGAKKDETKIREFAERLGKVNPKSRLAAQALAGCALRRSDFKAAIQYCQQFVELVPDSFEGWFNLGCAQHKTGKPDLAAAAFERAVQLRSQSDQASACLGAAYHQAGDLKKARPAYERTLTIDPAEPGTLWNLAILNEKEGKAEESEHLLAKLVAKKPDGEDAAFRLGYLHLERKNAASAVPAFEASLRKNGQWPEALYNLGLALRWTGNLEGAIDNFKKAIKIDPANREALQALEETAIHKGDGALALECHEKLVLAGAEIPELSYNLGVLLQGSNEVEAAAKCYVRALEKKPNFGEALLNLGHALNSMNRENEARACWSKAIEIRPEFAAGYFAG